MKNLLWLVCVGIVCAGLIMPVAGFAVEDDDLGTIVVTPSRLQQQDYKVSGNVTVITQEDIEVSNAQTVPEILRESVGAFVYSKNTDKTSVVDIRGFGDTAKSNVLVLVNDRRVNAIDMSGADFIQIPLESVEQIEIIRGAGTVLYGDNAVGGVINIITKQGKGELSGKVGATYGSFDSQSAEVEFSGEQKGLSYYLAANYHDDRGYRDNSDVLSKDFNTRLGYSFSDHLALDVNVGLHKDTTDLPGGLDESELVTFGRDGSANPADTSTTKDKYVKLTFDLIPFTDDDYIGKVVVDYSYRHRDVFESLEWLGTFYNTDRNIVTHGVSARYLFDQALLDREVNFVTGIDFYDHENDILGSGGTSDDLTISKREFAGFLFIEAETLDNLFLNAGTRYHRSRYKFNQRGATPSLTRQTPSESVNMVGAKYEYAEGSNIHLNVNQTFRFLATDEWYSSFSGLNEGLKQQTGIQYEVGVNHRLSDAIDVGLTPYWIDNKNEIYYNPTTWLNSNYEKTRRRGVEFDGRIDLLKFLPLDFLDELGFTTTYTFQNTEFVKGSNDGKQIPFVPKHQASSGLRFKFLDHFNASLLGRYVGSRVILNDLANEMPPAKPHYVLDAKVTFNHDNLEVFAAANNITDEEYSSYQIKKTAASRDIYPEPGTNYNFGMKVKF